MKYEILKEFINPPSETLMQPGDTLELRGYSDSEHEVCYYNALEEHGFIKKIEDEPWKPKEGATDYFIAEDGSDGGSYGMRKELLEYALRRNEIGNSFPTIEQRDRAKEWLKAFKVLRDDTKGFKPDWKNPAQDKFTVFYDHTDKYLSTINHRDTQAELIIFATGKEAKASAEKHRDAWLTFLGVEEDK